MKLTVLADNNTLIDRYFLGEPGLSFFVRDDEKNILFDLGYSGIFLSNARKMNIDASKTDFIVISHGHLDHTWGFTSLIRSYVEKDFEGESYEKPTIIGHPKVFMTISTEGCGQIGSMVSQEKLASHFKMELTKKPKHVTRNLIYLGQIPRENDFEGKERIGKRENESGGDRLEDDSAMAYKGREGLVVITGCSHSGICNIIEYAKKVCGRDKVIDVIGGFHLLNPKDEQLRGTVEYFKRSGIRKIHPCHCTDLRSKIELSKVVEVGEVGVGLKLEYD